MTIRDIVFTLKGLVTFQTVCVVGAATLSYLTSKKAAGLSLETAEKHTYASPLTATVMGGLSGSLFGPFAVYNYGTAYNNVYRIVRIENERSQF